MRAQRGGGGAAKKLHICNNFQGIIITPHSVMFWPAVLREALHFLCKIGFRVGMLEVNDFLFCFSIIFFPEVGLYVINVMLHP